MDIDLIVYVFITFKTIHVNSNLQFLKYVFKEKEGSSVFSNKNLKLHLTSLKTLKGWIISFNGSDGFKLINLKQKQLL